MLLNYFILKLIICHQFSVSMPSIWSDSHIGKQTWYNISNDWKIKCYLFFFQNFWK